MKNIFSPTRSLRDGNTIKAIAVLPPPRTGMTHVSDKFIALLDSHLHLYLHKVSKWHREPQLAWSLRKHVRLISSAFLSVFIPPRRAPIYIVLDSGKGAWGTLFLAVMARMAGAPLVVHHHVFSYCNKKSLPIALFFKVAGPTSLHIVLCDNMALLLRNFYPGHYSIKRISNAAFVDDVGGPVEPTGEGRRLGFLGNITREKGVVLVMEVVRALASRGFNVEIDIAGPVSDEALRMELSAFVEEDPTRRRLLGPVYGAEKENFFQNIDILLFPTRYKNEAQPITIFESLSFGVPVLATNRGCISDQIPLEWVFTEEVYVERVVSTVLEYSREPGKYLAAHRLAEATWKSSSSEVAEGLADLMAVLKRMCDPRPPF